MLGFHGLAVALTTVFTALSSSQAPLSITVSGNHFVNQNRQTVRLLGVDHQGTEYACQQGWAYSNGDDDPAAAAADAAAIAAWHANVVRVPLNEDCWLGINHQPSYGTRAGYRRMIQNWVADLNRHGLYAILDLHWSAPGRTIASGQWPMADSHSPAFWASVATTFKANHAVLFDALNEPFSPATTYYGNAYGTRLTWACWRNGGCRLPNSIDGAAPTSGTPTYRNVGMQAIVNAIRKAGASQPIMLGGLAYSNDLTGWLAHKPTDPDHQLAASFHAYQGEVCADVSCFNSQVAPVAAQVPVVIGEFDENPCAGPADHYDQNLMNWADGAGVSYLAWGWIAGAKPGCSDYYLNDDSNHPVAPNGTLLKAHLATVSPVTG